MVHFSLSTRVNFAGKRRLKFWSLQGTKSAHNLFLTNQALRICFDPNDSFQSFGMPLADYDSSFCIHSSRLISFFVRCYLCHFWGGGGILLDFIFLRTVLRKLQGMVRRLASGHTPSHSPLVKYLTTAFD